MSTLIGLLCLLFIRATNVVSLSLCGDSNYLEVKEDQSTTFVCTGITTQQNNWLWNFAPLSTCTTTSCTNRYPQFFQISRAETTSSQVTVFATNLDYLVTTNLSCEQELPDSRVTCQLDVVYPAEDAKCEIQFSGERWEVAGMCTVAKTRSRRNRYGCYVYLTSEKSTQLVGNFAMAMTPILGTNYSSGNCQIKIPLPPEGKYNYSVTIIPGEVHVLPSFTGSNEIRRPSEPPQHNCPQYVTEGEDVDCLCYSDNLGLPSGSLVWRGASSFKLKIDKVNRTYSGTNNVCILMWNNTAVQSTQYTVTVNYAPRVLSFTIDNKADEVVNVTENTNVSVVCRAEGRPLPTISLYRKGNDNQNHNILVANNVTELRYTIDVINCVAPYHYFCRSENTISMDQRNILLSILCSPQKTTNDSYLTMFVDGEASLSFKMVAYPPPKMFSIFFIGSANNSISAKVEHESTVMSTCSSDTPYSSMFTCTLTLLNQTIYVTGFYTVTFSNGLGNISFVFEVKVNAMKIPELSKSEVAGPVAGGVIGAFVVIALVVSTVIFIRRKTRKTEEKGVQTNHGLTSKTCTEKSVETLYDQLQRSDINSPSVYQALGHQQTSSDLTDHEDQGKSRVYEVPIDLHGNTKRSPQKEIIYQNSTFS